MAVSDREQRTFDRFLAYMRRFEPTFHGVRYDKERNELFWEFDIGREPAGLEQFRTDVVSDGLLRAAAIALLCAMEYPPSLILVGRNRGWHQSEEYRSVSRVAAQSRRETHRGPAGIPDAIPDDVPQPLGAT